MVVNKTYKTIFSEKLGTYIAVSENVKAKGKRSSSSKLLSIGIAVAVTFAMQGTTQADTVVDINGNKIEFTTAGGVIEFIDGGTITGLTSLTLN